MHELAAIIMMKNRWSFIYRRYLQHDTAKYHTMKAKPNHIGLNHSLLPPPSQKWRMKIPEQYFPKFNKADDKAHAFIERRM